jgi:hypothetical protein
VLTTRPPAFDRVRDWLDDAARPFGATAIGCGLLFLYLGGLAWSWEHVSYDVWGALLLTPFLMALVVPMGRVAARHEDDDGMVRLVVAAFALKLAMSLVRYAVAFEVYGGTADAGAYHSAGRALAQLFRTGDFSTNGAALTGTGFIRVLTGAVYTVTGPTKLGGFLVFSWLGFIGLWLFYRAFRIAVPGGAHRRYALLVLFLPSTLYWSSSIGKDAWMSFTLGIAAYGAARMLVHRPRGAIIFTIGTALGAIVRPHVALMLFLAVSVAYFLRRPTTRSVAGPVMKVVAVLALVVLGSLLLNRVEDQLGVEDLQQGGVDQALSIATERSDEGGSSFEPVAVTDPARYLWAVATVLFRPFPHEAGNAQSLLAALEGLFVLGLLLINVGNVLRLLGRLRQWSFGVVALVYTLVFCYAFASISNFGILTRQRVQVLPFLLVLVCLPTVGSVTRGRRSNAAERRAAPTPAEA